MRGAEAEKVKFPVFRHGKSLFLPKLEKHQTDREAFGLVRLGPRSPRRRTSLRVQEVEPLAGKSNFEFSG